MNTPLDELPLPKYKKQENIVKKQKAKEIKKSDYLDQILPKQWITEYFLTSKNNISPKKSIKSI